MCEQGWFAAAVDGVNSSLQIVVSGVARHRDEVALQRVCFWIGVTGRCRR